MPAQPFVLVAPATRGISLALTRHMLRTTKLPVYATHRSGSTSEAHASILSTFAPEDGVQPDRLHVLPLDLTNEDTIEAAASGLAQLLPPNSYMHTGFFAGGVLHPERSPADLDIAAMQETFQINVLSHLLLMKHFSGFLPSKGQVDAPAKWVHVSARVGSISDNRSGGWYSYRASKAALNQAIRTFDIYLQQRRIPAIAVGVHPGTVKTQLSKEFWCGVKEGKLFEPEYAAERIASVVAKLTESGRGKVWDWKGEEVPT